MNFFPQRKQNQVLSRLDSGLRFEEGQADPAAGHAAGRGRARGCQLLLERLKVAIRLLSATQQPGSTQPNPLLVEWNCTCAVRAMET